MITCDGVTGTLGNAPESHVRATRSEHVRLFRTDTPHDVASACLVAGLAPARDYLTISADKVAGESAEYLLVMRAMARAHRWADIIDITGLPINEHGWLKQATHSSRLEHYRDMRKSFDLLRTTIASRVPPETVDELFLTCLDHPDIQIISQVMPSADISYLPHGLGSMHATENETCVRWTAKPSLPRRTWHALASLPKRSVWGPAASPPLSFDVVDAYSFCRPPAIGRQRHDLTYLMTPDVMERLFLALPEDVRSTYQSLRDNSGAAAGLLLMAPGDGMWRKDYPYDLEMRGLADLASELVRNHDLSRIVVKPHPRNSRQWIARFTEVVQGAIPEVSVTVITRHSAVPIEVAVSAMNVVAAAGIGSSSLPTLSRIYGIPTYSSNRLMRELYVAYPRVADRVETWIRDNGEFYTTT